MDDLLLVRLHAAVDAVSRSDNNESEPSWQVIGNPNPRAPVVIISRDPRAGERLTPVFFAACGDESTTLDLLKSIYERSDGLARFGQLFTAADGFTFVAVPLMFHLDPPDVFIQRLSGLFRDEETIQPMAWISESCEVKIGQHGYLFRQVRDDSGRVRTDRDLAAPGGAGASPGRPGDIAREPYDPTPIHEVDRRILADALKPLISEAGIFAARAPLSVDYPMNFEGEAYQWRLADLADEVLRDHPDGLSATELADQIGHREAAEGTQILIDIPRQQVRTLDGVVPNYMERLIAALSTAKMR